MNEHQTPSGIDEALVPIHEYLRMLLPQLQPLIDEESGTQMSISKIELSMPIEIDVVQTDRADMQIGMSPPLYYVETGYDFPGHQIRLRLVEDESLLDPRDRGAENG